MTDRMFLVNKRTGHVIRIASFRWSSGWEAIEDGLEEHMNRGFATSQASGPATPDDWEVGTESHPLVHKYLNERHHLGLRH